jgi:hypothetical protein
LNSVLRGILSSESLSFDEDDSLCFLKQYYGLSDSSEIDDDNDLDFDIRKEKVVSSDSDLSDINLLVIDITKHRRKWLRKRVRPIEGYCLLRH